MKPQLSRRIFIGLVAASLIFVPGCATSFDLPLKTLTQYNATKDKVIVESITGIYPYGKGDARSNVKDMPIWPGQDSQEKTWGPHIELEYPITVKWHYASSPSKSYTATFESIDGVKGTKLNKEGSLVLFFGPDRNWHLKWVPGDSHLTTSELRKLAGISE
ncbi:hypothetical protein BH23VER1_BH23VER1_05410 [soil metagenome]